MKNWARCGSEHRGVGRRVVRRSRARCGRYRCGSGAVQELMRARRLRDRGPVGASFGGRAGGGLTAVCPRRHLLVPRSGVAACHSRDVAIEGLHTPRSSVDSPTAGSHAPLTGDLSDVVGSLHEKFDEPLGPVLVDSEIQQVADRFTHARIRAFVPLFVRRYAGASLRDHSAQQGHQLPAA